jgi:hypothetical protein
VQYLISTSYPKIPKRYFESGTSLQLRTSFLGTQQRSEQLRSTSLGVWSGHLVFSTSWNIPHGDQCEPQHLGVEAQPDQLYIHAPSRPSKCGRHTYRELKVQSLGKRVGPDAPDTTGSWDDLTCSFIRDHDLLSDPPQSCRLGTPRTGLNDPIFLPSPLVPKDPFWLLVGSRPWLLALSNSLLPDVGCDVRHGCQAVPTEDCPEASKGWQGPTRLQDDDWAHVGPGV